jgi:cobalt-zinc-cadmium efflux system outer membrane protein
MKTIIALTLLVAGADGMAQAPAGAPASPPSATNVIQLTPAYINQLAEEMRGRHPALQAAWARTNAAAAGVRAVRTWDDPMVQLGGMAAREEMRADEGDIMYGVEQKLPLFSKPKFARSVARAELWTEMANADYQFQMLRRELAKAAFRTALADEVVVIGQQDLAWLETMTRTMEGKYRAGEATLVETLLLQNERSKRATQLETDRDRLTHERVSLNRMLNRDLLSPWPTLELPSLAGPVVYGSRLSEFALKYEPRIEMLRRQIKQAEATVALTRRQRLPDVNAGLEARNYSGDGSFRQGVLLFSMPIPWVNSGKYREDVNRDEAKLRAAESDLQDYELSVREEVHQLTVKIDAARREALLYRDQIIPRSQSALESARSGWEANRNTFRDVLDARRMLLEGRLMQARAISEQYQMLSELVLCCGLGDLEALQMIGAQPEAPLEDKSKPK